MDKEFEAYERGVRLGIELAKQKPLYIDMDKLGKSDPVNEVYPEQTCKRLTADVLYHDCIVMPCMESCVNQLTRQLVEQKQEISILRLELETQKIRNEKSHVQF